MFSESKVQLKQWRNMNLLLILFFVIIVPYTRADYSDRQSREGQRHDISVLRNRYLRQEKPRTDKETRPTEDGYMYQRRQMDTDEAKDEFYYLFETAPADWSADQWGFFASLITFGIVALCFCCCMFLPMCCSGCACLQDILLTIFCVEVCCDTRPRYNGFFC